MIDKMNLHYSFTNPASVHDEEALTALELAGRQSAKINEIIGDQNALHSETVKHLSDQDKDIESKYAEQNRVINAKFSSQDKHIDDRMNAQNKIINDMLTVDMPEAVKDEVQEHIDNGTFDEQINTTLGNLRERVDNLLGSVGDGTSTLDAEIIDNRLDFTNKTHSSMGEATRKADKMVLNTAIALSSKKNKIKVGTETLYNNLATHLNKIECENGYLVKAGANFGTVYNENNQGKTTPYIDLYTYPELHITASARYNTAIGIVYDADKNPLVAFGCNKGASSSDAEYSTAVHYSGSVFTLEDALSLNPYAQYVRLSSFGTHQNGQFQFVITTPIYEDSSIVIQKTNEIIDTGAQLVEVKDLTYYPFGSIPVISGKYLNGENGGVYELKGAKYTNPIPVEVVRNYKLYVTANKQFSSAICCVYNNEGVLLGTINPSSDNAVNFCVSDKISEFPDATYIRLGSYNTDLIIKTHPVYNISDLFRTKNLTNTDVLCGKKILFVGDSFTAGDFNGYVDSDGKTGSQSDAYDNAAMSYKVYPYWVQKQTGAICTNYAECGQSLARTQEWCLGEVTDDNSLMNWYGDFIAECESMDYIILSYGLNDMHNNYGLGALDTPEDEYTFRGSMVRVFKDIYTRYPGKKIGFIIQNSYLNDTYRNAIKEMCEMWGVPYLDLKGNKAISTTLNKDGLCAEAKALKDSYFTVSAENGHPNHKAHEFMTPYIIEFLRGL